jgi:hypothetical protein
MYLDIGNFGLGVSVRAGLVIPPSLVRSTVDALVLLIDDRRQAISVLIEISGFTVTAVELAWKALVNRDSLRSIWSLMADLWNFGTIG